jgi:preprotein translocase subunit SecG
VDIIIAIVKGIHIIVSILLIITVLLQPGRGDDLGTIFGGTTQSIFGAGGAVPFLTKVTRVLAILFIATSLSLGYFSARSVRSSVVEDVGTAPVSNESVVLPKEESPSDISSTKPEEIKEPTSPKSKESEPQPSKGTSE